MPMGIPPKEVRHMLLIASGGVFEGLTIGRNGDTALINGDVDREVLIVFAARPQHVLVNGTRQEADAIALAGAELCAVRVSPSTG